MIILIFGLLAAVSAGPATDKENYKDQYSGSGHGKHKGRHVSANHTSEYCTDPRTMRKHAAYTEWADAYSCTRHRCQPGGRNLAIYTVGCKRVEAPESAIECEEVVEDTNMQFPFCCTRLRCLVVVRGEVWTRVLGQPWEVLPAAPWSHMYKMKKPPPADSTFLPKTPDQGPVYELSESESDTGGHDKVLRSGKKPVTDNPDCNEIVPRAAPPPPDIVIALSTNNEVKEPAPSSHKKYDGTRHKRARKTTPSTPPANYFEEDHEKEREEKKPLEPEMSEMEEIPLATEKSGVKQQKVTPETLTLQHHKHSGQTPKSKYLGAPELSLETLDAEEAAPQEGSEEKLFSNTFAVTQKPAFKAHNAHHQVAWTEIPQNQWNDQHEVLDTENRVSDHSYQQPEYPQQEVAQPKVPEINNMLNSKGEKPTNLQALVDAIGTRMRDIETVVQKMSDKVHQVKPGLEGASNEKRISAEQEGPHKHHKESKRPSLDAESYKRFSMGLNRGSKYLHSTDFTTELPLIIGETNLTGYFSDASNSVLRRNNPPKEPPPTYMAPVENRRKAPVHIAILSENSDDVEKKKKKHGHKKRKNKSRGHKKHHKDEKRKHFNKLSSGELDKNVVSLEDSSALTP